MHARLESFRGETKWVIVQLPISTCQNDEFLMEILVAGGLECWKSLACCKHTKQFAYLHWFDLHVMIKAYFREIAAIYSIDLLIRTSFETARLVSSSAYLFFLRPGKKIKMCVSVENFQIQANNN